MNPTSMFIHIPADKSDEANNIRAIPSIAMSKIMTGKGVLAHLVED